MSGLVLETIDKHYGSVIAVRDVNLSLPNGKFVTFLGPSGCGKTTLLRLIAGLETPTKGRILLDGDDITAMPAHTRQFGMVFQSLALFPHMTVAENIGYSLRVRGVDKSERRKRAEELLQLVQLPDVVDRHIAQLSGGQRQRVAIARALAIDPRLFLLDEPLSALDAKLRESMQVELRMLQQRLGVTTILVTHDQREAMTMSDIVVVMGNQRVQQVGRPLDIYRRPANTFVANFIGSTNLLQGVYRGDKVISIDERLFHVEDIPDGLGANHEVSLSIRPENIHVRPGREEGPNRVTGKVVFIRDLGSRVEIHIDVDNAVLVSVSTPKGRPEAQPGDEVTAQLPPEACVVLAS